MVSHHSATEDKKEEEQAEQAGLVWAGSQISTSPLSH